jgi:hypothetical protein
MQDFSGIAEKLKRAEENIFNLDSEMETFFKKCDYPVMPNYDKDSLLKAIEYHKNLIIPPRFSVLAGEVIHHLRSCFDHITWHFSILTLKNTKQIDFPIFEVDPFTDKDRRRRFEGKIAGIANTEVIALIKSLQPHNAPDPLDAPLWIINDFDITDKHKSLLLCPGTPSIALPKNMEAIVESYKREHPELSTAQIARHFKGDGVTQPCISFRNFGRRELHPITPGLVNLFNFTVKTVNSFQSL